MKLGAPPSALVIKQAGASGATRGGHSVCKAASCITVGLPMFSGSVMGQQNKQELQWPFSGNMPLLSSE